MSQHKHTAGPWRVYPAGTSVPYYDVCQRVVSDYPSGRSSYEPPSDADARLIAAAPEMLDALLEARDVIREFLPTVLGDALTKIEAAIAKASEGEEQVKPTPKQVSDLRVKTGAGIG